MVREKNRGLKSRLITFLFVTAAFLRPLGAEECHILSVRNCQLPYPDNEYLVRSSTSATGYLLNYDHSIFKELSELPSAWLWPMARIDGFSASSSIWMETPVPIPADTLRLFLQLKRPLLSDSFILMDLSVSQPVAISIVKNENLQLQILPEKLTPAHTYALVVRNIRNERGEPIVFSRAFEEIKAGRLSSTRHQIILSLLKDAGLASDSIQYLIEFTVRSSSALAGPFLHLRNRSMVKYAGQYTISGGSILPQSGWKTQRLTYRSAPFCEADKCFQSTDPAEFQTESEENHLTMYTSVEQYDRIVMIPPSTEDFPQQILRSEIWKNLLRRTSAALVVSDRRFTLSETGPASVQKDIAKKAAAALDFYLVCEALRRSQKPLIILSSGSGWYFSSMNPFAAGTIFYGEQMERENESTYRPAFERLRLLSDGLQMESYPWTQFPDTPAHPILQLSSIQSSRDFERAGEFIRAVK